MFKKILLLCTCFISINLFAHCDGCGTKTDHVHGTLKGNVKYQGKVPNPRSLKMDA